MLHTRFLFVFLALYSYQAVADSPYATWQYPPLNGGSTSLLVNIKDTIVPAWTSNFASAWLYVWCVLNQDGVPWSELIATVPSSGTSNYSPSLNSSFNTGQDWSKPIACHFQLVYNQTGNQGTNGPVFNLTSRDAVSATIFAQGTTSTRPITSTISSTLTSLASASASPVSITSTPTTFATSAATATATPSSPPSGGLSTGATVGATLGAVAGVALIGVAIFYFWRQRRQIKALQQVQQQPQAPQQSELGTTSPNIGSAYYHNAAKPYGEGNEVGYNAPSAHAPQVPAAELVGA